MNKNQQKKGGKGKGKARAPVAMSKQSRNSGPNIQSLAGGGCRIRHREYISDLSGSVAFSTAAFPINSGLARSFPWLSKVASRYESYRFDRLSFAFETEAPTSSTGVVGLCVDFDPIDAAPVSKTAALSYEGAVRSAPWDCSAYHAKRSNLSKRKSYFVRCGNLSDSASLSLHDVGNLFVITKGQADTSVIGELYVDYDIVLETPQTDPSAQSSKIVGGGTITAAALFGDAPVITGCLDTSVSGSVITFNQACQQLVTLRFDGTVLIAPDHSASTCAVTAIYGLVNATGLAYIRTLVIRAAPGETLSLDVSGSATVTASQLRMGDYQYSLA